MKICLPLETPAGLQSRLHPVFSEAEHLLVVDLEAGEHRTVSIGKAAENDAVVVDAILCVGIDRSSLRSFTRQGIQVFATESMTAAEALVSFRSGEVEELAAAGCCGADGHGKGECCGGGKEKHQCDNGGGCGHH